MQMVVKNGGTFSLNAGESVLSVLKKRNLATFSNCGGHGTCAASAAGGPETVFAVAAQRRVQAGMSGKACSGLHRGNGI